MKNMLFMMVLFCVSSLAGQARNVNANSFDDSLRSEADKLLTEWMDAFLAYQYTCSDSALDGGVLCPACARMHGRIGDAVLPLMYLAEKTGNQKYLLGAKRDAGNVIEHISGEEQPEHYFFEICDLEQKQAGHKHQ